MTKVWLDTDIGSDIDDAVCLAYLLAHPACELLGVTTVTGQGADRAKLASALCRHAGRDVPIVVGAEQPLLVPQRQPEAPQAAALASWPHDTAFPSEPAVELLRRTIRQHPGQIVLVTIGPLTNIALLFAVDPEIPGLLAGLVTMAGSFSPEGAGRPEWNVNCDPHAAAMVYRALPASHRSVGLNVTTQVTMDATTVRERFQVEPLRPVLDFAEVWFAQREVITFHDPLAAAVIFDDVICEFARGTATVDIFEVEGHEVAVTRWSADPNGHHEVATGVDADRFFAHYFDVVSG